MTIPIAIEIIKILLGSAALGSIWVAHSTYKANLNKQKEDRIRDADKELLNQAERSIEWAYNVLTQNGEHIPPLADRLTWLTCARHLLRQSDIAAKLKGETYKTVYAEIEEYWRHRFYLALSDPSLLSSSYFRSKEGHKLPENIEVRSALAVIGFARWKEGTPDPTDGVDKEKMIADLSTDGGSAAAGLSDYIRQLEEAKTRRRQSKEGQ
jgi:hypothetical protein